MSFIFGHRRKSPAELVKSTRKHIDIIAQNNQDERLFKKSMEKISLNLSSMKFMLYGDAENEPRISEIDRLVEDLFATDLLFDLLKHMKKFEFEARKDVAQIYNYVLRQRKQTALDYVKQHGEILNTLVEGYNDSEIALNAGSILREVIRHEELDDILLHSPLFECFWEYVQLSTFDIASDAFATFKLMLTKHKTLCAKFLETHFDDFVAKYNQLLQSRNYVTKRQSLKLLGELLLNRANFNVMMRYINSSENLKIMMNLLRGNTKAIQFEAFHVFKIFVANPKKSAAVTEILSRNKKKLIEFLTKFQKDKEDEQFTEEKNTLLNTLQALPDLDPVLSPPNTNHSPSPSIDATTAAAAQHFSSPGAGGVASSHASSNSAHAHPAMAHSSSSSHLPSHGGGGSSAPLSPSTASSFASTPAASFTPEISTTVSTAHTESTQSIAINVHSRELSTISTLSTN